MRERGRAYLTTIACGRPPRFTTAAPAPTSTLHDRCTCADLILMQVRHIQHHVGYCNGTLHAAGAQPAPWSGYLE